jgi:hypothetical protein
MLSESTFGNTADIYIIVYLVPHAHQHISRPYLLLLSPSGKSGQLCMRAFPYKKTWRLSLSIGIRITMIRCVVYLFRIFKMFHGIMNNPVECLSSSSLNGISQNKSLLWNGTKNLQMHLVSLHFLRAADNLHCLAGHFLFPSPPVTIFSS